MKTFRTLFLCLGLLAPAAHAQFLPATPAQQAQDAQAFEAIGPLLAGRLTDIQSLVVVLGGRVAYEFYRDGKPDTLRNVQSVEKSALSALYGIALAQGRIASLDQPVVELMPEWRDLNADPRAAAITLRHLLTFTAGFEVNDPRGITGRGMPPAQAWARPLAAPAGERFAYDNPVIGMLVAILEKATGMPGQDYARQQLAALEIADFAYDRGLNMRTLDMAKLGQLFLQDGMWDGKQLLPAAYAQASTTAQSKGGSPANLPYGQLWWSVSPAIFMASGYAGQLIWVHRPLQAVVAITSTVSNESQQRGHSVQLVRNALYAAIERRGKMEAR
ncbi:serine hydrolase domain-containing protein [Ramlibacter sp.]|uniref:serine hydrolase domain-containing protein n=1 Tax=Ramlibacter sp. TaxID=1917967 RepID=UPI002FCA48D1